MAKILGRELPKGGMKGALATTAIVSIPLALAGVAGYGLYRGLRFVTERLRPETEEELAARLSKIYHENHPDSMV